MNTTALETLIVFVGSAAILVTNRVRYDLVGLGAVAALVILGVVSPIQAAMNFGSITVVLLALVMILSKSVSETGILDKFGELIARSLKNEVLILFMLLLSIGFLSGFFSDVALTLMMIPVAYYLSDKIKKSPSKYLLPIAFVSVLGGRYTVTSTSSNVILYNLYYQDTGHFLPFFQFLIPGLPIMVAGIPIAIIISRIIKGRAKQVTNVEQFKTGDYLIEVMVQQGSEIDGKSVSEIESEFDFRIVGVYPGRISRKSRIIRSGDILVIRIRPETLSVISGIKGVRMTAPPVESSEVILTEVFVMPDSRLVGSSLWEIREASKYNISILGISAYGKRIFGRLRTLKVESGDVLVIQGKESDIAEFISHENLGPLSQRGIKVLNKRRATAGIASIAVSVVLATVGINIVLSFGIGLLLLLVTRTLNPKLMYRYVEWNIVVFVALYLTVGNALVSSGALTYITTLIRGSPVLLFLFTVLLANTIGLHLPHAIRQPVQSYCHVSGILQVP
ncbi:SLC13 family permease [Thermoplasmatales archaeon AK]|nr:SLC13 family permease [Thermoplasmatales archaeon AK]